MIFDFSEDFKVKKSEHSPNTTQKSVGTDKNNRKRRQYEGRLDRSPLKALKNDDSNIIHISASTSSTANASGESNDSIHKELINFVVTKENSKEMENNNPTISLSRPDWIVEEKVSTQSNNDSNHHHHHGDGNSGNTDLSSWVMNELKGLGLTVYSLPISDFSTLTIIQTLLHERARYQRQSSELSSENAKLCSEIKNMESDKEKDQTLQQGLVQDVRNLTNKIATLNDEHRSAKNHWLSEKNELLSRCLQIQALQTQCQGSLRKKEKEYERLHQQLEKLVTKEISKGKSSENMNMIIISKPLPRQLSQTSKISLRDAEIVVHQESMHALEEENKELRMQYENMKQNHVMEKEGFEETIGQLEDKYEAGKLCWEEEKLSLEKQMNEIKALHEKVVEETIHSKQKEIVEQEMQQYLKKLRQAEQTIRYQDILIRQALFGKVPSYASSSTSSATALKKAIDDMEDSADDMPSQSTRMVLRSAKKKRNTRNDNKIESEKELPFSSPKSTRKLPSNPFSTDRLMKDFLPPASPATMEVLKNCGWSDLPSLSTF